MEEDLDQNDHRIISWKIEQYLKSFAVINHQYKDIRFGNVIVKYIDLRLFDLFGRCHYILNPLVLKVIVRRFK